MTQARFSILARLQSFTYAFNGIRTFLVKEHNAWIHLLATITVVTAGIIFNIKQTEWISISFAIGLVWVAEILNTCIERSLDLISKERNPQIKIIKDMAAGAVLVAALVSVVIGAIVFIPYLITQ